MCENVSFRAVLVGGRDVGKATIRDKYLKKTYKTTMFKPIDMYFFYEGKRVNREEIRVTFSIKSGYRYMLEPSFPSSFRQNVGIMLVYDITNYSSFQDIVKWYNKVMTNENTSATFLLLGNKLDKKRKRMVPKNAAIEFAKSNDLLFMEASAIFDHNIDEAFVKLYNRLWQKHYNIYKSLQESKGKARLPQSQQKSRKKSKQVNKCFWCFSKMFPW